MRAALALCALALAACSQGDPAVVAERNWQTCSANVGDALERINACTALVDAAATPAERRAEALLERGKTRQVLGQYVRAIADFGRVLRLEPQNTEALLQRGMAHFDRQAMEAAARDFDAVLAIDPYNAEATRWREDVADGLTTSFDSQLMNANALIEQNPDNAALRNNRCWLRVINSNDLEAALADCNEALRLEPNNENALDSRGLVHYKLRNFEAALADYDAALRIDPDRGHYLFGRAIALDALGRSEEAAAAFRAAEANEPGVTELYLDYGVSVMMPPTAAQTAD